MNSNDQFSIEDPANVSVGTISDTPPPAEAPAAKARAPRAKRKAKSPADTADSAASASAGEPEVQSETQGVSKRTTRAKQTKPSEPSAPSEDAEQTDKPRSRRPRRAKSPANTLQDVVEQDTPRVASLPSDATPSPSLTVHPVPAPSSPVLSSTSAATDSERPSDAVSPALRVASAPAGDEAVSEADAEASAAKKRRSRRGRPKKRTEAVADMASETVQETGQDAVQQAPAVSDTVMTASGRTVAEAGVQTTASVQTPAESARAGKAASSNSSARSVSSVSSMRARDAASTAAPAGQELEAVAVQNKQTAPEQPASDVQAVEPQPKTSRSRSRRRKKPVAETAPSETALLEHEQGTGSSERASAERLSPASATSGATLSGASMSGGVASGLPIASNASAVSGAALRAGVPAVGAVEALMPGEAAPKALTEGSLSLPALPTEMAAEHAAPASSRKGRRGRGRKKSTEDGLSHANDVQSAEKTAANEAKPEHAKQPLGQTSGQKSGKQLHQEKQGNVAAESFEDAETNEQADSNLIRNMLVSVLPGDMVEVVLTEDNKVREYYVEMTHQVKIRGNIYKGVINNIDANLQAAFVNYGNVKNGFLQIDEVHPEYYLHPHEPMKGRKYPPIQKVLKPGQEVLVQVVKEPSGTKGAFLTTWVSLAGRFLVLTPGQEQIGISRKVEDGEERSRLRELIKGLNPGEGLGAIVRTVSAGTSKTTLQKDLNFLKRVWKDIRKRAGTEKAPCLIYQEPGLASRCVRDYLSDDVSEVWVDDASTADAIREMTSLLFPRKGDLVRLYEKRQETLWEHFKVIKQIEQVHAREVIMPSGGRLVFDQTEALMAIDINSGRIGGKTNFESMAHRTNMEAAVAIAQQLRLRDVGGQIVIDFIEMRDPDHCREVEKTLRNAMKGDRARHDIGKMSSFGLLQIVRQRTGASVISISTEPCPHCAGTGQRRNMEWQAVQALRDVHRLMRSSAQSGQQICCYNANSELGLYLLNHKRERLAALERELNVRLDIRIVGINDVPVEDKPSAPQSNGNGNGNGNGKPHNGQGKQS